MSRRLVNVNVKEVKAAARQSAADLGYSLLKTSTRGGSCPVCNRPRCICSTSNCCHTCCGKLIAFLQNKLQYWSVTRLFLLAKKRQCQTSCQLHISCRRKLNALFKPSGMVDLVLPTTQELLLKQQRARARLKTLAKNK